MFKIQLKNKNGFALLEIIFYVALLAILSVLIINSLIGMTTAFRETRVNRLFAQGATMVEIMSRELRQASAINSIGGTSIEFVGAGGVVTDFILSGGDIDLQEGGVSVGDLNPDEINVDSLSFTQINTTLGKAVKIEMTISVVGDTQNRTANFYNTVVLRGGY